MFKGGECQDYWMLLLSQVLSHKTMWGDFVCKVGWSTRVQARQSVRTADRGLQSYCCKRLSCQGAYSLLTDGKQAMGSDNLSHLMHFPLEKCCNGYKIRTYGTASSNEWNASSIRPNLKGGSTLCHWVRSVVDISLQIP